MAPIIDAGLALVLGRQLQPAARIAGQKSSDGQVVVDVLVGDELPAQDARPVTDDVRCGVGDLPHCLGEAEHGSQDVAFACTVRQSVRRSLHGHPGQEHEGLGHEESASFVLEEVQNTPTKRLLEFGPRAVMPGALAA